MRSRRHLRFCSGDGRFTAGRVEVVLHKDRVEEFFRIIHHGIDDLCLVGVRADAEKPDLSLFFTLAYASRPRGSIPVWIVKTMELDYVDMVGLELRQACLHILDNRVLSCRFPLGFRGHVHLVAYASSALDTILHFFRSDTARCIHVIDAHIEAGRITSGSGVSMAPKLRSLP